MTVSPSYTSFIATDNNPVDKGKFIAWAATLEALLNSYPSTVGDMLKSANLAGLANVATARSNLGLAAVAASGAYSDLSGTPVLATSTVAGRLARFTNTTGAQGQTSALFEDGSGNIGVGTVTPGAKVEINAGGNTTALLLSNNDALSFKDSGGTLRRVYLVSNGNAFYMGPVDPSWATSTYVSAGTDLNIRVNGTSGTFVQGPYVNTAGSVGLGGNTNPQAKLDVTGDILASSTIRSSSPTAGIGYAAGAGGTVTQATSKTTAVTLNKICGTITMNNASLAAGSTASFTLNNSTIGATDQINCNLANFSGSAVYLVWGKVTGAGTATITLYNFTGNGALAEAVAITFTIIKSVNS